MKKIVIFIIVFLFTTYFQYSKNVNMVLINNTWLNYFYNTTDKYIYCKGFIFDPLKFNLNVSRFNYYNNLSKYLSNIDDKLEIIRIINVQDYYYLDTVKYKRYYNPQAYFLYRKLGSNKVHLLFTKEDCSIIDTIFHPIFNFEYLLTKSNYRNFGGKLDLPKSYLDPCEGMGISLSIASEKDTFSVYSYDFWQYGDGKIKEFTDISGDKKTIKEVRKLVKQLYEMGIIKDEVFETECK